MTTVSPLEQYLVEKTDGFCPYSSLCVPLFSSEQVCLTAFRRLSLSHHPDKGGNKRVFQRINNAKSLLCSPEKDTYDKLYKRDRSLKRYKIFLRCIPTNAARRIQGFFRNFVAATNAARRIQGCFRKFVAANNAKKRSKKNAEKKRRRRRRKRLDYAEKQASIAQADEQQEAIAAGDEHQADIAAGDETSDEQQADIVLLAAASDEQADDSARGLNALDGDEMADDTARGLGCVVLGLFGFALLFLLGFLGKLASIASYCLHAFSRAIRRTRSNASSSSKNAERRKAHADAVSSEQAIIAASDEQADDAVRDEQAVIAASDELADDSVRQGHAVIAASDEQADDMTNVEPTVEPAVDTTVEPAVDTILASSAAVTIQRWFHRHNSTSSTIMCANDAPGPAVDGLACPPDVDPEVFASLPLDIQQEIIAEAEVQEQKADPANAEGESSLISREMSSSIHV